MPARKSSLGEFFPFVLLAAQFRGVIFGDELAHFLLEGQILGAELHVHDDSPLGNAPLYYRFTLT